MEPEIAREWAQSFENKSISELEAMPPPLLHTPKVLAWNRARQSAIAALQNALQEIPAASDDSELKAARQSLVNLVAARAARGENGEAAAPEAPRAVIAPEEPAEPAEFLSEDEDEDYEEDEADAEVGTEEDREFTSEDRAENLRARLAAAIARNNEPAQTEMLPAKRPLVLPQGDATAILERQLNSGAAMVEEIARHLIQEDCSVGATSEFMKSVSMLMTASASVGKVVNQLRGGGVTKTHHHVTVEQVRGGGRGSETLQTNGV